MSETSLAPSTMPGARLAPGRAPRGELSGLEALERGFALFRSTFARDAWRYYLGVVPLMVLSVSIWIIDGQIQISNGVLLTQAALLAACYLLRAWMVGSYMQHVRERAFNTPRSRSVGIAAQSATVGRLLAWKITLSGASLVTLPTIAGGVWFFSGCQFASLEAYGDTSEKHSFAGCLALAGQWFGSGVLLFFLLVPLWLAVWLNGLILALVFPQLLHSIFGFNTLISTEMGLFALVKSSAFWLSLSAGTWLTLDPVVKCTFVVVYQHLRSRREGDDLRGRLASLPRHHQNRARMLAGRTSAARVASSALLLLAICLLGLTASAQATQVSPDQGTVAAPDNSVREARINNLRQALEQESQRAIYRWHDAEHPTSATWFDKLLAKIGRGIRRAWDALSSVLGKLWPSWNFSPGTGKPSSWQLKDTRFWLILVGVLTLTTVVVLLWLRRRRNMTSVTVPMEIAPLPDLNNAASATERSEDEWFSLARRLEGQGDLRYALRATYLGLLAGLSQREWLTIRRDHTNREYLNEFTRRWRRRPQASVDARNEIPEKLGASLRQFDRVWYGSYGVTGEAVAAYRQDQREFLNHV